MLAHETPPISHWSTDSLDPQDRSASVLEALGQAMVPVRLSIGDPAAFEFHMSSMDLDDGISVLHQVGSPHASGRGKTELARSDAHTFHFLINFASDWTLSQRGDWRIGPGEGVLVDSAYAHDLSLPTDFEVVHVMMDEAWLRRWVAVDIPLAGRRFALQPGMSCALDHFAAQMCPHLFAGSPMSTRALADKFGALLAMACSETQVRNPAGLCDLIQADMAQRCAEPGLIAADIARDLHLSEHEVHAGLLAGGLVFSDVLSKMRRDVALRMLQSQSFAQFTLEEISARAGFADVRALRKAMRV